MSKPLNAKKIISFGIIFVLIPVFLVLTSIFTAQENHYIISLGVIFYTMVPFFLTFEKRKPKARELVIIATLCAIAVAGRAVFFLVPNFKPVIAIVVVTGIVFGGEIGFMVGAMSGFVSNFFFGQGPWTPWQMFGFGIIGFLAGIVFMKNKNPSRWKLLLFGVVTTYFLYGVIVNIGTIFMSRLELTLSTVLTVFLTAVPMDAMHVFSTAVFLFFLGPLFISKLKRIKDKFGLV